MLSVLIPALNEEKKIEATIRGVDRIAREENIPLQILVVNDGSTDGTKNILENLKRELTNLTVIHNSKNIGVGASLRKSIPFLVYPKTFLLAGDNDLPDIMVRNLFRHINKADLIIAYLINREERGVFRTIVSSIFQTIYMITYKVFVQYVHGPCIYPTELLKQIPLKSTRFSIAVEILIKLLRSGCTFHEIAGFMQQGLVGSTSLSFKNLREVVLSYCRIWYDVKIKHSQKFNKLPIRIL